MRQVDGGAVTVQGVNPLTLAGMLYWAGNSDGGLATEYNGITDLLRTPAVLMQVRAVVEPQPQVGQAYAARAVPDC